MKILIICASNICRSPFVEFILRREVNNDPSLKDKIQCGEITSANDIIMDILMNIIVVDEDGNYFVKTLPEPEATP